MIVEPWFPKDRCPHKVYEISIGEYPTGRMRKLIRCLACHTAGWYPATWLNLRWREGGEEVA